MILVCAEGRYGPDCERECRCDNGGKCIPSTGACDCPAGFIGARCDISESETVVVINCECGLMSHLVCVCVCVYVLLPTECPAGRYGLHCAQTVLCGHGARNDPVSGRCICAAGRRGENCGHGKLSQLRCFVCADAATTCSRIFHKPTCTTIKV